MVYDLKESVIACRNAMRLEEPQYTGEEFEKSLPRAMKLAKCGGGSGHSNFRKGIRVSFDIKYPNYISPEMQRYGFLDIVCSQSKMHRLTKMDMDACFNEYVCSTAKRMMKVLIARYNRNPCYDTFMRVLSNCPQIYALFHKLRTIVDYLPSKEKPQVTRMAHLLRLD